MIIEIVLIPILIAAFFYIIQLRKTIDSEYKAKKDLITINENLKKSHDNLTQDNSNLKEQISESTEEIKVLTEKNISTTNKLSNDVAKVLAFIPQNTYEDKSPELKIIIDETEYTVNETVQSAKEVNTKYNLNIDTSPLERTMNCLNCGKKMQSSGYKMTPWGYAMHYRCPEHGEFPSNHIDDMWDE